jgi:hypothetical protein
MNQPHPTPAVAETAFQDHAEDLLGLARTAIDHGLQHGRYLPLDLADFPAALHEVRSAFVTLRKDGELRGCIGSVEAHRPLAEEVARNAHGAAFNDPRFPGLTPEEWPQVGLSIEILSPAEPVPFTTEAELLEQLEPEKDGLILEAGRLRGTFLPTVWSQLPEPRQFWTQLKRKAGLPADYFSPDMVVRRYRTEKVPRAATA